MLWDVVYPSVAPDDDLAEGDTIVVAGAPLTVMHTPGHSPGGVALYAAPGVLDDDGAGVGHVFGGDTLFNGGPGATGRSFSSFDTIIESIRTKLFALPDSTVVHTGHGDDTSIGAEAPHLDEWIAAHD
jgi:glyoxylase-like metal-dependent hydrolase (beta-lactamase superfamily II)